MKPFELRKMQLGRLGGIAIVDVRVWNTASVRVLDKLGLVASSEVSEDLECGDSEVMCSPPAVPCCGPE
jgi:hypothetical protein